MKKTHLLLLMFSIFSSINLLGQVGIDTETPNSNSNLDINSKNGTKGVMLPKITSEQETTLAASLNTADQGLAFYNTNTDCLITWNGSAFNKLCEQGKAEFTVDCATSSANGTYRVGYTMTSAENVSLSINVTKEGPYDISGTTGNGYYFRSSGYLTEGPQEIIISSFGAPLAIGEDTVIIKNNLNSTEICSFNIPVLSGDGIVEISPTQCSSIPSVNMIVGSDTSVTVEVPASILLSGQVNLTTETKNGVTFTSSQFYTSTGTSSSIQLHSGGIPETVGTYTYTIQATSGTLCTFTVNVIENTIAPEKNITSVIPNGTYIATVDLSAQQSISAQGIQYNAPNGGTYGVGIRYVTGGTGNPGLLFTNQTGTLSGPQTLNMTFPATPGMKPTTAGTYTYELYDIYSNLSLLPQFQITIQDKLGEFGNPASKCTDILTQYSSSPDGYYWVKDNATTPNKYKTYCDMTNGGWTLIKSVSEKTILVTERKQNESINSQTERNPVTTESGAFNEYRFSLSAATVTAIGSGSTWPKYVRITIKEKGHTTAAGATKEQVENSTTAPVNDSWLNNNYWNITLLSPLNAATGNINGQGSYQYHTSEGKIFGFPWGKASTANNIHTFNGVNFATTNPPGLWNQSGFFTGFYGANGYVSNNNATNNVTYTSSNGSSATFNKYYINDVFGLYMNNETQLNHHIGTCANSTDDYGGASFCNAGWNNWRPHNFNNGEGRILQYWLK